MFVGLLVLMYGSIKDIYFLTIVTKIVLGFSTRCEKIQKMVPCYLSFFPVTDKNTLTKEALSRKGVLWLTIPADSPLWQRSHGGRNSWELATWHPVEKTSVCTPVHGSQLLT